MSSAIISPCEHYRYALHREISGSVLRWIQPCLFIMLNPSTADATADDPTIRRCMGFARREGCTTLTVVNLFALRSTDPDELLHASDPFGRDNADHVFQELSRVKNLGGTVIGAWGSHKATARATTMRLLLQTHLIQCLGENADGNPKHPLYLPADAELRPWKGIKV